MIDKVCLVRFQTQILSCSLLGTTRKGSTFIKGCSFHFLKENLCPVFRQKGGKAESFPISAVSQLPLAQNNAYAKVTYFGVAYSDPFQSILILSPSVVST